MPKVIHDGQPGTTWTNGGSKILYQFHCEFHNSCGVCISFANCISTYWPIPFHRGCRCSQAPLPPGSESLPFVDFIAEINKLPASQQTIAVGRANWKLIESGTVKFSDVVTPTRVRTLAEVVSRKKLTVATMTGVGVNPTVAAKAYETVHTPAHELAAARRKELLDALSAKGATATAKDAFGKGIAAKVSIKEGPSGPGTMPTPPKPPPPPPVKPKKPKPPDKIDPVVAKKLGVKPPVPSRSFSELGVPVTAADRREMFAWAGKHWGRWADSLPEDDKDSLRFYKGSGYGDINGMLRTGRDPDYMTRGRAEGHVRRIDRAIAGAVVPGPVTLWRGTPDRSKMGIDDPAKAVGLTLRDPGFVSTSMNRTVAEGFSLGSGKGAVFRIAVPKGTPAAYLDAVSYEAEAEILLARGTAFRVTAVGVYDEYTPLIDLELIPGGTDHGREK